MSVYRITEHFIEDGRHELRGKLRIQYALLIACLCAALGAAVLHSLGPREEFHTAVYVITIAALITIVVNSMRDRWHSGLDSLQETVATYRLSVEPGRILCIRSHAKPIVLEPQDIVKVQEDRHHGLHLCTKDPKLCIVIPPQLENFDACKDELRAQGLGWRSEG